MRPCDGVCAPVCGSLEGTDRMPLPGSFSGFGQGFGSLRRKQEKVLPLFRRPDGHICPRCGQKRRFRIDAFSSAGQGR